MSDEPNDERILPGEPQKAARPPRDDYPDDDDRPRRRRQPEPDDVVTTLIPYRNGLALAGYYVGVFSLIPCLGLILGPIAIVLGILGLKHANKRPEAKGKGHAITAIVLGGLVIFLHLAVIGIFVVAVNFG